MKRTGSVLIVLLIILANFLKAQEEPDKKLLTVDRIYNSDEFTPERQKPIQWIENGSAYVTEEPSSSVMGAMELVRYSVEPYTRKIFIPAEALLINGKQIDVESFSLSPDGSKVLIFTNSSRVWRTNTKGDYWVYDLAAKTLRQIGKQFKPSSLMFAKFQPGNKYVAYVHDFNIYTEDFESGAVKKLTEDGNGKIINGTFDWVYEEEFGKRDGFSWSPDGTKIAFWQLDASMIGTFYMINNTDSVYSKIIPIQYPKVGQEPSAAKVGIINISDGHIRWISLEGGEKENYIPGMQWVDADFLLIQQINRKQNQLTVWTYKPATDLLDKRYVEKDDTWVDILYPDIVSSPWADDDLLITDAGKAFLRMTENDGWRHVYKINIETGEKALLTPGNFDVAAIVNASKNDLYFIASPTNSAQRYLYRTDLKGKGNVRRVTPDGYPGVNSYDISPDCQYAVHTHRSATIPLTSRLVKLPDHRTLKMLVENLAYREKLSLLSLPEIRFLKVKTADSVEMDVRMIMPVNFDQAKKYPVLFHVYGEPWDQMATDSPVGLFNIMLAQKGYVVVDMDNRGTPCLKGSEWRHCIYRKIGLINARDQAMAANELLKLGYIDKDRTAVWGWSGGGSMTLNLMFQYPDIYKTGMAVAPVSNQLLYDNVYQERYMGLPQENMEDFIKGSPVTYAKNLKGNLLIVHGTGDDNVHFQNTEVVVNELIRQNKQFSLMIYPNRSHGIYEGENTTKHLYTLLLEFLLKNTPPGQSK